MSPITYSAASCNSAASRQRGARPGWMWAAISSTTTECWATEKAWSPTVWPFQRATRIMAPLSGGENDRHVVAAGVALAEPFGAELACVHAPPDVADLIPWMGDGFMGGVQASAGDAIREAASEGAKAANAVIDSCPYA